MSTTSTLQFWFSKWLILLIPSVWKATFTATFDWWKIYSVLSFPILSRLDGKRSSLRLPWARIFICQTTTAATTWTPSELERKSKGVLFLSPRNLTLRTKLGPSGWLYDTETSLMLRPYSKAGTPPFSCISRLWLNAIRKAGLQSHVVVKRGKEGGVHPSYTSTGGMGDLHFLQTKMKPILVLVLAICFAAPCRSSPAVLIVGNNPVKTISRIALSLESHIPFQTLKFKKILAAPSVQWNM